MWQNLPQSINPVALSLGPIQIHWYAFMWLLAFGSVFGLCLWRLRRGEKEFGGEFLQDLFFNTLIGALFGGRIGYVLFYNFSFYVKNPLLIISPYDPSLGEWIGIAGMSYHGGAVGVAIAFWWTARKYRLRAIDIADFVVPAIGLGYFFGRLGNFFNLELFGRATTVPWGMYFGDETLRHPSQIYEAFGEGLLVFAVLWTLRNRSFCSGTLAAIYVGLYGFARFVIEFYRAPDVHIGFVWGMLTIGQILSIIMMVLSIAFLLYLRQSRIFKS